MVRVIVADDHDIFRRGLRGLVLSHPGWQVVGEAKTGREAIALTEELKPDIVVIDISMPELNGLEAARQIHRMSPKIGILILTQHFSDQLLTDIVDAGARAYVMKSDADRDFVSAIEAVTGRRTFFTDCAAEILLDGYAGNNSVPDPQRRRRDRLTTREREVVQLLADAKTSKEVASVLGISVKTAETHRANIMKKLEIHSVTEVVHYALKNQIVEA
jgi:DNA-binding NarL/FixJ family response regulator